MPIEVRCPKCDTLLRVADEHAGRSALCPQCQNVFEVTAEPPASTPLGNAPGSVPGQQPPSSTYPEPPTGSSPFGAGPNPFASPNAEQPQQQPGFYGPAQSWHVPDRGGLILAFGIIGLIGSLGMLCCFPLFVIGIFAPVAWVMGRGDLKQMDAGVMNPGGRGTTQTGVILGIVGTIFMGIAAFLFVGWIFFSAFGNF